MIKDQGPGATEADSKIDRLIVNSPYEEPQHHWSYDRQQRSFELKPSRRPAGYLVASKDSKAFDDPGVFCEISKVNQIRDRVREWRHNGYLGVSGVTARLLQYWRDPEEFASRRFFFCQLESAETLIWISEAPEADKFGIDLLSDGGPFRRLCAKMATGSGKTVVMAMVIAWQILNKVAAPTDSRFSKNVLIVAPGITVRDRLKVLDPQQSHNYYEEFRVVPSAMMDKLRQGRMLIRNWQALNWETKDQLARKKSVDKRGPKSDAAYVREALGEMAKAKNILVINDEAHHAWRTPAGARQVRGVLKADIEKATKWVGSLDRINRARGILGCYDFSATPFVPGGSKNTGEALFGWIVSDFGLNDAIESGLVKTPRVVIRDDTYPDANTYRSRFYHIYGDSEVKDDLNRRVRPESVLPDLVINAYTMLGHDWQKTAEAWRHQGEEKPPVMITVANRTQTAARVKHAFDRGHIPVPELCDPERTLHIDSNVLRKAEAADFVVQNSKSEQAERLRQMVDTVGKPSQPGEMIQNVISVGMLTEGWDAKTVTHIMGLRAFASQLLCEQVVGRGLRRRSYDVNPETGLLEAEYVNIFGVPFSFLPHESGKEVPPPTLPKTLIEPEPDKKAFEISWPNVVRIARHSRARLSLNLPSVRPLELDARSTALTAELASTIAGKPFLADLSEIELRELGGELREQRIIFKTASRLYDVMHSEWTGGKALLVAQLVRIVEQYIRGSKIEITPQDYAADPFKRRITVTVNMTKVVRHLWESIRFENTDSLEPVLDRDHPILSTGDMRSWYTGRPCSQTKRSHINFCVYDSTWENSDAWVLDHAPEVEAWVKNDHLGFEVMYTFEGMIRKYRSDFLVKLHSGTMLIVETKGKERPVDRVKHRYLQGWVQAINAHGGFGRWSCIVTRKPGQLRDILKRHAVATGH